MQTADLAKVLDKAYKDATLAELVDAPVSALAGVSGGHSPRPALREEPTEQPSR
jgi:hypothetical protein